jgi:hypothetical protein
MSFELYIKYGSPNDASFIKRLKLWDVPADLEIGVIPKRIYCHPDLIGPLSAAFKSLISTGAVKELKTWDGCYNPRPIRGFEKKYKTYLAQERYDLAMKYYSTHAWGLAIDVNAFENGLGKTPKLSKKFVKCFKDAGFIWGGDFKRLDGMHFELNIS